MKSAEYLCSALVHVFDNEIRLFGALPGESAPERRGIMERLVNISMALFQHSAFIGAFALGAFFALGRAPCAVSLVFLFPRM